VPGAGAAVPGQAGAGGGDAGGEWVEGGGGYQWLLPWAVLWVVATTLVSRHDPDNQFGAVVKNAVWRVGGGRAGGWVSHRGRQLAADTYSHLRSGCCWRFEGEAGRCVAAAADCQQWRWVPGKGHLFLSSLGSSWHGSRVLKLVWLG
jgi:hypothetical protein